MPPILCLPDGLLRFRVMSGTPDTLEVKAIVPFANAANGLPDGANVTDSVSTISAYISFDVWRTFDRLQGRAGVLVLDRVGTLVLELGFEEVFLQTSQQSSPLRPGSWTHKALVPR